MSKVAIVTDSTAYIPDDLVKKHNLTIVPLILLWGNEAFEDGVTIQPSDFYTRLSSAKVMPTTSQATIPAMQTAFEGLVEKGFDVLGIFISSKLSGTVQSAMQGRDMMMKGADKVAIVDSLNTAMAMGFQALTVARAAEAGENLAACVKLAEAARDHIGVYFAVDTLEFLHRGGRIGGAQALLGSALNIKPVLSLQEGKVESVDKVRTKSKVLDRVLEIVVEQTGGRTPVRLATLHANAEDEARALLAKATAQLNPVETVFSSVSPVIGTHTGPGTVGLAYMAGM
ncbi:MAG: DegV family protein [Anaerolineales bacterium]|nr:DegV family protein [Anaerolineales bacterium]